MKNNAELTQTTETVEFPDYKTLEPKELIILNEEYTDHIPMLKEFINDNMNKQVNVPTLRMNGNGNYSKKVISGLLTDLSNNSFTIVTSEDYYGVRDHKFSLEIRFDNVLGIIPLHPERSKMNPLAVNIGSFKSYFESLSEMKTLLRKCLNPGEYAITLHYSYTKENRDFHNGYHTIYCDEIIEVNQSNVKYKHLKTTLQLPNQGPYHYVDLSQRDEIDRFIAPDRYLYKVTVTFGTKHDINFLQDDDEN